MCPTLPVDGNSGDELLKGITTLLSEHEKSKTERIAVDFESIIMSDYWMLAAGVPFFSCIFLIVAIRIYAAHCRLMELAAIEGRNRRLSYLRSLARMAWELSLHNRGLEVQAPRPEKLSSGLDSSEIETLPTFIFKRGNPKLDSKESIQCCVCIEEFKEGEKGRTLPTCGHSFHAECVDMWFFTHTTCPLCRKKVGSSLASKLLANSPDSTTNGNDTQISDQGRASSSESYFDLEIGENSGDPQSSETASRQIEEDRRSSECAPST